jgi:hypothetical protein
MRDMSRAIRHELADLGTTLQDISDQDLAEVTEIVGAFFYDLVGEQDRRGWGNARPAATVARTIKALNAKLDAHHQASGGTCILCEGVDATLDSHPGGPDRVDADRAGDGAVLREDPR